MKNKSRKSLLFLIMLIILLMVRQDLQAASLGVQTFTFLAKSEENKSHPHPVFWITEDIGGDYQFSRLLLVTILPSQTILTSVGLRNFREWNLLKESTQQLETELYVELKEHNGNWKPDSALWYIRVPSHSKNLSKQYEKYVAEDNTGDGINWNRKHGLKGVQLPIVGVAQTEQIYFYPVGLYINYDIARIYYFPKSKYILIFTHQNWVRSASGGNTMHGFLLLKLTSQLTDREKYKVFDFNGPWLSKFNEEHKKGIDEHASWTEDPKDVALRIAGVPIGVKADNLALFDTKHQKRTIVVSIDPIRDDDSIAAEEIRVDFVQHEGKWKIEWAGGRWRCQTGRGQSDWAPRPCR